MTHLIKCPRCSAIAFDNKTCMACAYDARSPLITIQERIDEIEKGAWRQYITLANYVFHKHIEPFLKARNLKFIAGNGTYCVITHKEVCLWLEDYQKFKPIYDILELSVDGQPIGSLMPDYKTKYNNYYKCPACNEEWEDVWDSMCNDKCPKCNKEIEPYRSEEI